MAFGYVKIYIANHTYNVPGAQWTWWVSNGKNTQDEIGFCATLKIRLHNKATAAEKTVAGCRSVNVGPFRFSQGPLKVKELGPSAIGRTRAAL